MLDDAAIRSPRASGAVRRQPPRSLRLPAAKVRTLMLVALAAALVGCRGAAGAPIASPTGSDAAPTGTSSFSLESGGLTRTYRLHVPAGVRQAAPLLIELHGGGGDGQGMDRLTGFFDLADREGFVAAAPDGIGHSWNDGRTETAKSAREADDIGFLRALIERIATQTSIDPSRVYVVGMSNGAIMTGRVACEMPDQIAAVAQVAGTASVKAAGACHPGRAVPVLEIHGTADPLVPYGGGTVAEQIGGRGDVVSVDSWAQLWATNDSAVQDPSVASIGTDSTVRSWHGATVQSDVVFYRVDGAGHTWPSGPQYLPKAIIGTTSHSFDASEVIWQFLASHRLP